jgi:hypothetical protein
MAFRHTKKVEIVSFTKARIRIRSRSQTSGSKSGSDQKGPDPTKKIRIRPDPDLQHCLKERSGTYTVSESLDV